jgi:regulatory protein
MYLKKQISAKKALVKAQNLCASQEKCKSDIRKKLYDWNIKPDDIENIIDQLTESKFIDETRYAEYFVRDKFRFNKWGRIKIEFALKQKQIPQEIIRKALSEINETEYCESLKNELIKKHKSIKDTEPYKIKEKLLRFAQSRGYEPEISLREIEKLQSDNN